MGKAGTSSLSSDPLLRIVDRIYQGAVDPHAWPGILSDLVTFVGGSKGVLVTHFASPKEGGFAFLHSIPETFLQQWADHFRNHDLWTQATAAKGLYTEGSVVLDSDLVPEAELFQSTFYRDFLKHQGIARLCAGVIFGQDTTSGLATACSIYRDSSEARFGEIERQRMHILVPHLSRALGVMFRLRDAELRTAATLSSLDKLSSGVVLLDSLGMAVHLNRAARRILAEQDGLSMQSAVRSRLVAADAAAQSALDASIASAIGKDVASASHFSASVSVPRPSGEAPYVIQSAPLPDASPFSAESDGVRGILFITDPGNRTAPDAGLLKQLYGITPAEARLAAALCCGETLLDAARRCKISEATARTQLRGVFEKTGTHRQADLVRLLLSIASSKP